VLLREHAKKPITKAELKAAVLRDRPDRSGKIMKVVVASANKKLAQIAGLELVLDNSNDAEEDGADVGEASQAAAQSQGGKGGASQAKYLLVNKLHGAVALQPSDAALVYTGFVEAILQLIERNQGACMAEDDLYNVWLPKLGLAKDHHLPQHNTQKVEDLIGKRMVSEAYLRKRKSPAGNTEFVAGARAAMTRNAEAVQTFHDTTILNRTTDE